MQYECEGKRMRACRALTARCKEQQQHKTNPSATLHRSNLILYELTNSVACGTHPCLIQKTSGGGAKGLGRSLVAAPSGLKGGAASELCSHCAHQGSNLLSLYSTNLLDA